MQKTELFVIFQTLLCLTAGNTANAKNQREYNTENNNEELRSFMSLHLEEVNETQQLMQNEGDEEEQKPTQLATSPVTSNKMSDASLTSRNPGPALTSTGNNSVNESTKISYVSEKKLHRDLMRSNYSNKPKRMPKETPDVKHMEKALLELLDDFHTGKLSAFGSGCSMEQMISIRDQQEHLARLHFRLCADVAKPTDDSFENAPSRDKMAKLVQSLEQLSTSIEHLHSDDTNSTEGGESSTEK